jgi:hypothetical protein
MKAEQLKLLGKVIEFPKNKDFKNKEMENKFYVATELLKEIIKHGHEFNITVTRDAASEILKEQSKNKLKDLLVISTSEEFERESKYKSKSYFFINGDEF